MKHCSTEGCASNARARGLCTKHYQQLMADKSIKRIECKNQHVLDYMSSTLSIDTDDCITWPFSRLHSGRPQAIIGSKKTNVCRWVCEKAHGTPPTPSHQAAHSCGKGHEACINHKHLRWATSKENIDDMLIHGTRLYGSKAAMAKLTEEDVRFILSQKGKMQHKDLASLFGVSRVNVTNIMIGRSWVWLTEKMEGESQPVPLP